MRFLNPTIDELSVKKNLLLIQALGVLFLLAGEAAVAFVSGEIQILQVSIVALFFVLFISSSFISRINQALPILSSWLLFSSILATRSLLNGQEYLNVFLLLDSVVLLLCFTREKWIIGLISFCFAVSYLGNHYLYKDEILAFWAFTSLAPSFQAYILVILLLFIKIVYARIQLDQIIDRKKLNKSGLIEQYFDKVDQHTERFKRIDEIHHFADVQIPKIREITSVNREKMSTIFPKDYNKLLGIATEVSTSIDFLLRNIDQHIRKAKSKAK